MQEIATGVYVGNINTRVREKLWDRSFSRRRGGDPIQDGVNTFVYMFFPHMRG